VSTVYDDANETKHLEAVVENVSRVISKIYINRFHRTAYNVFQLQAAASELFHNIIVTRIGLAF